MKLRKGYWITASIVLVCGGILTAAGIAAGAYNQDKYAAALHVKDRYFAVEKPFSSIRCTTETENIRIVKSEDDSCSVKGTYLPDDTIQITIQNDTLCIDAIEQSFWDNWYRWINIGIPLPESTITVFLPDAIYDTLTLQNDVGNITVDGIQMDNLIVENEAGEISLQDFTCKQLSLQNAVGDVSLKKVQIREICKAEVDTGNMVLETCNVYGSGEIASDVGNLRLTDCMLMRTKLDGETGDITLTDCTLFDDCSIENDVGDIRCTLYAEENSCSVLAESNVGEVWIDGQQNGYRIPDAMDTLTVKTDVGDIRIDFSEPVA